MKQEDFIKTAKKVHEVADFTHSLTMRALILASKRIIEYGYNYAEFKNQFGKDFKFANTKRLSVALDNTRTAMIKIAKDSIEDVANQSLLVSKRNLDKIPREEWDLDAFLASIIFGKTYSARIEEYIDTFKNEMETIIKVAQEQNMTANGAFKWYSKIMEDPRADSIVLEAIAAGVVADLTGLSAYRSLRNLNDDMVVRGFASANRHYWQYAKAKFVKAEKDDKTCDTCLGIDGKIYPIDEDVVPVHGSCRCIEVPIVVVE